MAARTSVGTIPAARRCLCCRSEQREPDPKDRLCLCCKRTHTPYRQPQHMGCR